MGEIRKIDEILPMTGREPIRIQLNPGANIITLDGFREGGSMVRPPQTIISPTPQASREILQSYLVTSALYDFDVYEKRVLYNIIKFAQKELAGIRIKDNLRTIDHSLKDYVKMTLPISDFLTPTGKYNHHRIKAALKKLQKDSFTYMDSSTWESITLIAYPKIEYSDGLSLVSFLVSARVWDVLLNFSKGYSKFYFDVAFSLESAYSMRFYELMSSQSHPISYSIESLRKWFELDKPRFTKDGKEKPCRYPNTADLIRKVIDPAKRELDRKSPVTFTYTTIRRGRKITGITFTPVRQDNLLPARAQFRRDSRRYGCTVILNQDELDVLLSAGFTKQGIDNNLDVFADAKRLIDDFLLEITLLKGHARDKENPCGWIIDALRGKVQDIREARRTGR